MLLDIFLGRLKCKDIEDLDQKVVAQSTDSFAKEKTLLSLHQRIAGFVTALDLN